MDLNQFVPKHRFTQHPPPRQLSYVRVNQM